MCHRILLIYFISSGITKDSPSIFYIPTAVYMQYIKHPKVFLKVTKRWGLTDILAPVVDDLAFGGHPDPQILALRDTNKRIHSPPAGASSEYK
jgi:hypothetical protein